MKGRAWYCELCNRRLPRKPTKNVAWCQKCLARHVLHIPCRNCNGLIHFQDGVHEWPEFTSIGEKDSTNAK